MSNRNDSGRTLAQTGVMLAAKEAHRRIDSDPNLDAGARFWAHLGIAALEFGGHYAVDAIADWAGLQD
jgi:hypothetical protein